MEGYLKTKEKIALYFAYVFKIHPLMKREEASLKTYLPEGDLEAPEIEESLYRQIENLAYAKSKRYSEAKSYFGNRESLFASRKEKTLYLREYLAGHDIAALYEHPLEADAEEVEKAVEAFESFDLSDDPETLFKKQRLVEFGPYLQKYKIQAQALEELREIRKKVDGSAYLKKSILEGYRKEVETIYKRLSSHSEFYIKIPDKSVVVDYLERHNDLYIEKMTPVLEAWEVEGHKLDEDQIRAALTDEDNTLLVASAGSGKTLTLLAKAKVLLEAGVSPNEILMLSYSRKSAEELQERMKKVDGRLKASTFHSLGLSVLREKEGRPPMVDDQFSATVQKYFMEEVPKDPELLRNAVFFISLFGTPLVNDRLYSELSDYYAEMKGAAIHSLKDEVNYARKKEGKFIETLRSERVKSYEEMNLANFYFLNGIEYVYEKPYEPDAYVPGKRRYCPDFYLSDYGIYHEHYGINKDGKAPQFGPEGSNRYAMEMEWKRNLHEDKGTTCLETYSYEFADGTIYEALETRLKEAGVAFKPLSEKQLLDIYMCLDQSHAFHSFLRLVESFLSLYKSRYRDASVFDELREEYPTKRDILYLDIAEGCYRYYYAGLRSEGKIDFDDMILEAGECLKGSSLPLYSHILVDEFQDISASRAEFLKKLRERSQAALYCVGDDWQSIYRFAGSDVSIFYRFFEHFGEGKRLYLGKTHRLPQEALETASSFIMANPEQSRKKTSSTKSVPDAIKVVRFRKEIRPKALSLIFDYLYEKGERNILLLGRNNFDIENYLGDDLKAEGSLLNRQFYSAKHPQLNIAFSTVHAAKGLEEDSVIILNAEGVANGFPNRMEDDEVLRMVMPEKEEFPFAEERRLFYVALTRSRKETYIFASYESPSVFLKEILPSAKVLAAGPKPPEETVYGQCPDCGGDLVASKFGSGDYLVCSNRPFCEYQIKKADFGRQRGRCPECGDYLLPRKDYAGHWFCGCHRYPLCGYTRPYVPKK